MSTWQTHSAIVHMQLRVNGHVLPVAQMGLNFLVLKDPIDHPPALAELSISIDGKEDRLEVCLHNGIDAKQRTTNLSKVPATHGPMLR
jgi:hypothetical protein